MRIMLVLISLLNTSVYFLSAQTRPIHGQQLQWPPASGVTSFMLSPAIGTQPPTLSRLVNMSSLIVEGIVEGLSVRQFMEVRRLETDVVFQITRVLKGPSTTKLIAVKQEGGIVGGYTEQPLQYSLMKYGERYLLFVIEDKRPTIPAVPGMSRYLITGGEWIGNFRIDGNAVHLSSAAPPSLRQQYEGASEDKVVSAVMEVLKP